MRRQLGTWLLMLLTTSLWADGPVTSLQRAIKTTLSHGSWSAELRVEGGVATGPLHEIGNFDIERSYLLRSEGELCQVSSEPLLAWRRAFRAGGALRIDGQWVPLGARQEGRELTALARPVLELLRELLDLREEAVWGDGSLRGLEDPGEGRHIRVEGSLRQALEAFNVVQRSGIFEDPRNFEGPRLDQEHIPGALPKNNYIVPEMLEKLDRSLGKVVYDVVLNARDEIVALQLSLVFGKVGSQAETVAERLSSAAHVAIVASYQLSEHGEVELETVPRAARKHL